MDYYEGLRLFDDLKNYLILKIFEYSLLSSVIIENSEIVEEILLDDVEVDMVII